MKTVGTFEEAQELAVGSVGLVPTMGFLHEGHLSLIDAASDDNDCVVVSLFVNPLQFNEPSDLAAYPRDIDRDTALARSAGADVLFVPDVETMYPIEPRTNVVVRGVSEGMEGTHRPGHFVGVATVVAKLLAGLQPGNAYFGRKDAQQLAVVRTMTVDLSLPVQIHGMSTVRESDGLAVASRNVRIAKHERPSAVGLSQALFAAGDAFEAGERSGGVLREIVMTKLGTVPMVDIEYVEVARARDASIVDRVGETAFIGLAARIGGVRLIDNVFLDPETERADRGVQLDGPSILYGEF